MEYTKGKVVFLGDTQVGKTAIINFYNRINNENIDPTIAANSVKTTVYLDGNEVNLNLWDTAGQENYRCLLPLYVRGAQIGVVVFDLSNPISYNHVDDWINEFRQQNECKMIVVGNKNDLDKKVDTDKIHDELIEKGLSFFQTSAKTGDGIELLFHEIASIVDKDEGSKMKQSVFSPENVENEKENSNNSCC